MKQRGLVKREKATPREYCLFPVDTSPVHRCLREQTVSKSTGGLLERQPSRPPQCLAEIVTLAVAQLIKFLGTSAYHWTP